MNFHTSKLFKTLLVAYVTTSWLCMQLICLSCQVAWVGSLGLGATWLSARSSIDGLGNTWHDLHLGLA